MDFKPKKLISDINDFIKDKNNLKNIIKKCENKVNEMNIIYKLNSEDSIKLFDSKFIKNNKQNCFLLINNKKYEICEKYNLNKEENNRNLIIK